MIPASHLLSAPSLPPSFCLVCSSTMRMSSLTALAVTNSSFRRNP